MKTQKTLYDQDYYVWLNQNIEALQNNNFSEIDIPNLIEELRDKVREERNEIFFGTQDIIYDLLKTSILSDRDISRQEVSETLDAQQTLSRCLYESPSLNEYMEIRLEEAYEQARLSVQYVLGKTSSDFPKKCPYTIEQILNKY